MRISASGRKYIFLVNPISGTAQKSGLQEKLLDTALTFGVPAIVLPTVASGNYKFVQQKIEEEGYTDVIICGGDGTVNQVIGSLRKNNVNFGIIPMGSGNGLAFSAKIPKTFSRAVDLVFTGKGAHTDAFMVNDQFACMLCGVGFDAKVAHDFANQPSRGLLTYTQQTFKNFLSTGTYHFEMQVDNHLINTESFFISIANSNQFGNQFTIAPKARLDDGLLDIVVVPKMNKAILPFALIQQISGGALTGTTKKSKDTIQYFQAAKLQLKNKDLAPLHIDGEPKETAEFFNIKVIPKSFRLIRPQ
jgi:YegS/Rv2252/BmrU family lipid kinase